MTHSADIVILSATPAGIAAAIAAARLGRSSVILERTSHIGGLPANGLGITDIVTRAATGGIFNEFIARIREHYRTTCGETSQQFADCADGYRFEPHVAELMLEAMLAEQPAIRVLRRRQFDADAANVTMEGSRLTAMTVTNLDTRQRETFRGSVFIDASYEGDLASAAGVAYRVGRESAEEYGEPCAGRAYWSWTTGELLEGSTGEADHAIQAYNYRVCLTTRDDRVPIAKPADYRREDYLPIIDDLASGRLRHAVYRYPRAACAKPVPIPNGKFDTNDHPKSLISTDLPKENWPYPDADWTWRDRFARRLRDYELGMLWFCQHDDALPAEFRADAMKWGLPCDEFADNGHFPRQVYVREARRIVGEYTFTARDCMSPDDVPIWRDVLTGRAAGHEEQRPPAHHDSVTGSHYPLDSHACRKREPGRSQLDGYIALEKITRPYTVPYRVMVPQRVDGLLVPVACSASHLGFGTLRMEPCWMALGHAAGVAGHLAIVHDIAPRSVDVPAMQGILLDQGAVLIYIRDVPAGHPLFRLCQHLGVRGLFTELDARLDELLDDETASQWSAALGVTARGKGMTRGSFLKEHGGHLSGRAAAPRVTGTARHG